MPEDNDASKGGRPSHADKIAQLEQTQEHLYAAVASLTARLDALEAQPKVFAPTPEQLEAAAAEYCDVCGSVWPFHFELASGVCPRAPASEIRVSNDIPTVTAPAETAAA